MIIYVADAANHRIAKVDRTQTPARITTFAGVPGKAGFRDGPGNLAQFNDPYSLDVDPKTGVIYVADRLNNAIRRIVPSRRGPPTVETVVGGPRAARVPPQREFGGAEAGKRALRDWYSRDTSFADATINYPQVLRVDSQGNVVFGEDWTRTVRRVTFRSRTVERVAFLPDNGWGTWIWLDVDTDGVIGPVDDILVALSISLGRDHRLNQVGYSNDRVERFSSDVALNRRRQREWERGARRPQELSRGEGRILQGNAANIHEPTAHYPWAISIDDAESRYVVTGFGSSGVYSVRRALRGDPEALDVERFDAGSRIHRTGTASGFPPGVRPGYNELYGERGFNQFGASVLNFDDIALLKENRDGRADSRRFSTNVDIARFVRGGMDGVVRRPELTGDDLVSYIYFIRTNSLEGQIREINPQQIADDLARAQLHAPNDTRLPEIRDVVVRPLRGGGVRVTWKTDEPTLGVVTYGPNRWYGLTSPVERDFNTQHAVELRQVFGNGISGGTYHYSIRARDVAGNTAHTQDATFRVR